MLKKTDEYYIRQILAGKPAAYAKLVDRHKNAAFNLAFRLMQNREEAEEIAQDAFVKAYNKLGSFKSESKFGTWLYRIVYNTAISKLRLKNVEKVELNESITDSEEHQIADGFADLAASDRRAELEKALTLLSDEDSMLVVFYYWEDQSIGEIAETMQMTVSNVKIRLMRARKKLYSALQKSLKTELREIL